MPLSFFFFSCIFISKKKVVGKSASARMDKKLTTVELRERLDRTLSSPDLMNEESLRSLVKDQLLRSPFCGTEGWFSYPVDYLINSTIQKILLFGVQK